jgi:crotonobetainyl-CoA:carnitine CoA-transferase CaiB-like acyl-CoA transferase
MGADTGLLSGIRVLDLSVLRPGPYATQLLAEIGADVLKVEPPGGDPMRNYPELFVSLNANKRSVVLDLKRDADRARALELAAEADVLIEGFRPDVAARLGVGYDDICAVAPSIVYCSLSGMGQTGPLRLVPGHDLNYQAWAGALAPEGGSPEVSKLPIADLAGGMAAAFAVCAAVVRRLRTGEGEYIDAAMTDVLATWTGAAVPRTSAANASARGVPGYGLFTAAGGAQLTLGVLMEDHFWTSLCDVLGMDDVRELTFAERMACVDELQSRVAHAIASRDRDELVDKFLAADVPVAPVLDRGGMLALPHLRERSVATSDPWADPAIGYPVRLVRHPAGRTSPSPALDEHRGTGFLPRPPIDPPSPSSNSGEKRVP